MNTSTGLTTSTSLSTSTLTTNKLSASQKGFSQILVILAIIILGIAGGVYYFGKSQSAKPAALPSLNPMVASQTSQPTSTPDETANWKTYKEDTYKFIVQYPSGWAVTPFDYRKFPVASPDQPQAIVSFVNKSYEGMEMGTPGLIDIGIIYVKPQVTFAEFLNQQKTVPNVSPNKPLSISDDVINVAGTQSHKVTYKYNEFTNTMVYVPKGESIYIVRSQVLNNDSSLNTEFFDRILSTFKFTQ